MNKLIVFLGNPGREYEKTRHNIAQELCSFMLPNAVWQKKFHGLFSKTAETVYLIPQTYMNLSGTSVQEACSFFSITPENVLAVHDDMELPFGKTALKQGGGCAGHNGLRDIEKHLSSASFCRLRMGIGRPSTPQSPASFVLARFTPEEEKSLEKIFENAENLITEWQK